MTQAIISSMRDCVLFLDNWLLWAQEEPKTYFSCKDWKSSSTKTTQRDGQPISMVNKSFIEDPSTQKCSSPPFLIVGYF